MFMCKERPSWSEIKDDVTACDMKEIIDMALEDNMDIEGAIQDYIEANYEPTMVPDTDAAYDAKRDEELLGE